MATAPATTKSKPAVKATLAIPPKKTTASAPTASKPAAKPPEAKTPKPAKIKGQTIGSFALEQMKKGLDNKAVLAAIKVKYPEAKTGMASINWYRNKAMSEGVEGVKGSREITSAELAVKKAKDKAEKDKQKAAEAAEKAKADKEKAKADKEKAAADKGKAGKKTPAATTSSALD